VCGIFGFTSSSKNADKKILKKIILESQKRGSDSSGLVILKENYEIFKSDREVNYLIKNKNLESSFVIGHTRLITNGYADNQPVNVKDNLVIHNGIITNENKIWERLNKSPDLKIDTETLVEYFTDGIGKNKSIDQISNEVLETFEGVVCSAILLSKLGKLILLSNNGSLFIHEGNEGEIYFASEKYTLVSAGLKNIRQIKNGFEIFDVPASSLNLVEDSHTRNNELIYEFKVNSEESNLLEYNLPNIKRCTKCILPETMPFIKFNEDGVCNYCTNYTPRNNPKPKEHLIEKLEKYKRNYGDDCLVPFSGGRDSCMGLHLIVKEFGMKPITYTYDWGMVTDLGRRNISRMSAKLGVENIIVAADIHKKRSNIKKNISAWLKNPDLGMVNIFTAGDKHFFRYLENVKKETGISLNLWGVNPLEVTHFKAGFLGMPPEFAEEKVYYNGIQKQIRYHSLRFKAMLKSPAYFNDSLFDTLQGEYYRSFLEKSDYYHLFDYWRWDEHEVDETLCNLYDWEKAIDTNTTWRIGDGTAAFYNYIYFTVAGFSEHETFRSNQIREGDITREAALKLALDENIPRFQNIRWYLDCIGLDFKDVISTINSIPKLYDQ